MVYSLDNNAPATPDFSMESILMNDAIDKVSSTSASNLVTNATYILVNDVIDKVSSTSASASSLVTDTDSIIPNDAIDNIDSQFYDVQNCNSVQIIYFTYAAQKDKLINYFATALTYQLY